MPLNTFLRNKVITWLEQGKTYSEIIKLVEFEGGKISRSGINYIKTKYLTEQTEQKTEQKGPGKKQNFKTALDLYKEKEVKQEQLTDKKITYIKFLTDLEFELFEKSLEVVYNSNYIRLRKANATGILNALDNLMK
ncbi:MAG TPA: hypothetical protein ENI51_08005, partial [Candidatus Atribacteria bacterium]|nr:hypothetical protein [Candidatus Atribacteria bacterium]